MPGPAGQTMSDLTAAAAKLGVSEAIVKRSAEARAKATGSSVDEVLAAWAGGATVPTSPEPAASSQSPASTLEQPAPSRQQPAASQAAESPPPVQAPVTAPIGDGGLGAGSRRLETGESPPLLVGRRERLSLTVTGSIGLLVLSLLLGLFLPSAPQPANGVRSSKYAYSSAALRGQEVYSQQGCAACHTQLIRSVAPDANLGPVSLDDTNQVIGSRRIGPDLAAVGGRIADTAALLALLAGEGNHPSTSLSDADLSDLLAYLRESR